MRVSRASDTTGSQPTNTMTTFATGIAREIGTQQHFSLWFGTCFRQLGESACPLPTGEARTPQPVPPGATAMARTTQMKCGSAHRQVCVTHGRYKPQSLTSPAEGIRINLIPRFTESPGPTLRRSHNDDAAIRYLHLMIATDASFALCQLQSVASPGATSDFGQLLEVCLSKARLWTYAEVQIRAGCPAAASCS